MTSAQSYEHLIALQTGLSNEKARLSAARKPKEIALRTVWVKQLQREVNDMLTELGMPLDSELPQTSGDDLLAELGL